LHELGNQVRRLVLDREGKLEIDRTDEIGQLANAFANLLAERKQLESDLHSLNSHLEERIASRTLELERSNEDLKVTLQNLETAQNELVRREKLAALGAMVAGVSHELNTPIGNSLVVASALQDQSREFSRESIKGVSRSALDRFVSSINEGAGLLMDNLRQSVALVSSFKQVAVDQTSENRRDFDLHAMVDEYLRALSPMLQKTSHAITNEVPEGIRLDSYPGPLGQVLTNLISNALIHGLEGRPQGTVLIQAHPSTEGAIQITVIDNGWGIAPEHLGRVFDPFFTTRFGQGGSGLGLNIVYNIVTHTLGGTIHVESVLGEGAAFIFELPHIAPVPDKPSSSSLAL
jgi:signal transduction histidine kinase